MSDEIDHYMKQLVSKDDTERFNALQKMLEITEQNVTWFNEYKDTFITMLQDENSYHRSIALMLLCNLARNKKDRTEFKKILPLLMNLINDEKFITQRQYIQNIWKAALADKEYKDLIVNQLENEFLSCTSKKHYNLLRMDIIGSLGKIAKEIKDGKLMESVLSLIEREEDEKNKKKYKKAAEGETYVFKE